MRTQCHYISIYVLENAIDGGTNLLNLFHSGSLTGFGRKSTGKDSGNVVTLHSREKQARCILIALVLCRRLAIDERIENVITM